MRINEILDSVLLKNRVTDAPVTILFDGEPCRWEPGEAKPMPKALAGWFRSRSDYKHNLDTGVKCYKLVILASGQDETDLTFADIIRDEKVAREEMNPTHFDPETGKALRYAYVKTHEVPGVRQTEQRLQNSAPEVIEREAKQELAGERRGGFAAQIEAEASKIAPEEIEAGVRDVVKHGDGIRR